MDFEAPSHGGNPFLCDDDYVIPTGDAAGLNPFLTGDFDMGVSNGAELNPFLSGTDDDYLPQDNGNASTNPFAMFGVEETDQTYSNNSSFFDNTTHDNGQALFGDPVPQTNNVDLFDVSEPAPVVQVTEPYKPPERPPPPARPQPPAMAPGSLVLTGDAVEYCAETANIFNASSDGTESVKEVASPSVPGRPPPPRPAPPSRETQQLILSVTGAMDATSSDLLDRLRATKTPSPTPIRDLHSPSPTPDANRDLLGEQESDFLMCDDTPAPPPPSASSISEQPQTAANFMDLFGGEPESKPEPPPPTTADLFGIFENDETKHEEPEESVVETTIEPAPQVTGPPPRPPVPAPMVVKPRTPPQEADLLGDFSSPNAEQAPKAPSAAFAAEPVAQVTQKVPPPRPPSPAAPLQQSAFHPEPVQQPVFHPEPVQQPAFQPEPVQQPVFQPEPVQQPVYQPEPVQQPVYQPEPVQQPIFQPEPVQQPVYQAETAQSPNPVFSPETVQPPASQVPFSTPIPVSQPVNIPYHPPPPEVSIFSPPQSANAFNESTFIMPEQQNAFDDVPSKQADDFDAFEAKFESAFDSSESRAADSNDPFRDPFGSSGGGGGAGAWGADTNDLNNTKMGFGGDDDGGFDAFLSMNEPPPAPRSTPARNTRQESADSDDGTPDFAIVIRPKTDDQDHGSTPSPLQGPVPVLAPPPRSPVQNTAFADNTPRFNPFDGQTQTAVVNHNIPFTEDAAPVEAPPIHQQFQRTDSQETPPTPLFDEDVSQPLEEFPRVNFSGEGWEMHLRQPNKKKITGQRFWKKVFVRLVYQGDNPVLQLSNTKDDKDPFQELPLQPCYSISDIGAQQFDQYGKIFTVKLQYVFYKERPGVRPGQVTKAERITNKLSQFAAYAIQGDYQGVKEFGSDLRKLGLPVEHAPQISQLLKIGSQNYEDMKQFSVSLEEALFRMPAHRDRALHYKMEEVQITAVDELYLEQDKTGHVCRQIARVRVFFLGFISGMPDLELGVNDIMRQGKEVVGRHDIIPVVTEEWIRLEKLEFHSCVLNHEYEGERVIRFKPPDACYIELLRFRVRPPKNRELPLQTKATICVTGNKVEIKCDILVPGFSSRKLGQIPCEDIMLRIPIPECWIYLFRIEKHFRYGSVKSAHRRTGKIKGIERFLGTVETLEQHLIEVTSGSAKYEHQHHAIVWRISRLPKEGQGAYTNHEFVCRFQLTSYDQIPEELAKYCYLEFTMPSTQASHTTVRSLSVCGDRDEDPPEKCVRHLSRMEYRIEIDHTQGSGPGDYITATTTKPTPRAAPETVAEHPGEHEKDSDSDSSS